MGYLHKDTSVIILKIKMKTHTFVNNSCNINLVFSWDKDKECGRATGYRREYNMMFPICVLDN